MRRKIAIAMALVLAGGLLLLIQGSTKFVMSYDGSAPSGYANDPAGGSKNCSQCHGGTVNNVTGWITSNIPGAGYTPSTMYTFTATCTGTGGNKGFEISPQNSSGTFLGTLISGTGTSLTGSSHYIRSSGSGITTNPMSWTFTWTSPATGLGPVTFYGSFQVGKGTGANTYITSYTVSENTTGISENSGTEIFSIYPNPVKDLFEIKYSLDTKSKVEINVYSLDGKKIATMLNEDQPSGNHTEQFHIKDYTAKGIYLIELKFNDRSTSKKIIIE